MYRGSLTKLRLFLFQEEMWLFNDDTKAKFGKQKRKFFIEAVLEIENNPEIALEDM